MYNPIEEKKLLLKQDEDLKQEWRKLVKKWNELMKKIKEEWLTDDLKNQLSEIDKRLSQIKAEMENSIWKYIQSIEILKEQLKYLQ
jgi:uncharacterized protein YnzC (UPF0291/DUF896 family)